MSEPDPLSHILDSAERDRTRELARAARILHDQVGQHLTAVGLALDLLAMDYPQVTAALADLRPRLESAFASVRALSYELSPDLVERAGLHGALESLARRAGCSYQGKPAPGITLEQASGLYRVAECALDNAVQHSGANHICIRLLPGPPATLEIEDDGSGFDIAKVTPGYGLSLVRHTVSALGLTFSLRSGQTRGTIVQVSASR